MARARLFFKVAAAGLALSVLGAGAAVVALKTFFPEPRLRAMALEQARKALGREVTLERIGVGLMGVTLEGLEISESPAYGGGTFLGVRRFRLRPSWRALARKRLTVVSVSAEGLTARLVKGADGRFNYETLLAASTGPARAPAAAEGGAGAAFDVGHVSLSEVSLVYEDRGAGAAWKVSDLRLSARRPRPSGSFPLELSGRVSGKAGGRPVDAAVSFAGEIDWAGGDPAAFRLQARELSVEQDGLRLQGGLRLAGLDAPKAQFDVALSAAGKALLTAEGRAESGGALEVDARASTPGLDTTLAAKLLPDAGIPALKLPAAELALAGSFSADRAEVRAFRAEWKGGRVEASGAARGLAGPRPAYSGKASFGVDVPAIEPGEYPFLRLPPKLRVPAARLDGELALAPDRLEVRALKAKTAAGTVSATGSVRRPDSEKPVPDLSIALALDLPSFAREELPVEVSALRPGARVPALRVDGTVEVAGDDVRLRGLTIKGPAGSARLDGAVARALAGEPRPDVTVAVDADLPALTERDLPFAGLPAGLALPASRWKGEVSWSPARARIQALRVQVGRNDVEASGTVEDPGGRASLDLLLKCRSFVLEELAALTPAVKELRPRGSGFFALSITGRKEKPLFAGKLQFKDLGAEAGGVPLSGFSGTVSFDESRVDAPNLTGKAWDSSLKADVTVKDYSRVPEVQVEASLDRFDLGRYLASREKAAGVAKGGAPAPAPDPQAPPARLSTRGGLSIGVLAHQGGEVADVRLTWSLRGVSADMRALSGDASLRVGKGRVRGIETVMRKYKIVKAFLPVLKAIQAVGRFDLDDIAVERVDGDYGFQSGVMTLRRSELSSDGIQAAARGTVNLPAERLDVQVDVQMGRVQPIPVSVTGTFDDPKIRPNVAKFAAEGAKNLIEGLLKAAQPRR